MAMTIHTVAGVAGPAIQLCQKEDLDAFDLNWPNAPASATIENFAFDERDFSVCYVYPPPAAGASVELVYVKEPTPCSSTSSTIDLPDQYEPALRAFTLAIAYERCIEGANPDRAAYYMQQGTQFLAVANQDAQQTSPNVANQEGKVTQTGRK
jgi:hypothetical protein